MAKRGKVNQKTMVTVVGAIVFLLLGVTIAYAALSQVLNITVNQISIAAGGSNGFDVHFKSESVTGVASNSITGTTTGIVCGTATSGNLDVSVADTTLNLPGDTCTYTLTVQNTGDVVAYLQTIAKKGSESACGNIASGQSSYTCGNITYKLTESNGTSVLATGTSQTIAASTGTKTIKLIITHNDHDSSALVGTATNYSNMGFTLTFTQSS